MEPSCSRRAATRSASSSMPPSRAACRMRVAAAVVSVNIVSLLQVGSVFALGAQQARQAVALLLRPAAGEHLVQVVVAAALGTPAFAEVADHHAHLRLHAVLGPVG